MAALHAYVATAGSACPPQKTVVDGFPLGMWVHNRRRQYRSGSLPPQRIAELEEFPDWLWNVAGADWEYGFAMLHRYVETHGDASPAFGDVVDDFRQGEWVRSQRARYRRERMPRRRIEQLEAVPGWTWKLGS